ncbi:MAG: hypothetical protein ACI90V_012246 [Bacillariaceae sp.]|jgi:hypothetical protein
MKPFDTVAAVDNKATNATLNNIFLVFFFLCLYDNVTDQNQSIEVLLVQVVSLLAFPFPKEFTIVICLLSVAPTK